MNVFCEESFLRTFEIHARTRLFDRIAFTGDGARLETNGCGIRMCPK